MLGTTISELWAKVGGCLVLLNSPDNVNKWKEAVGGWLGVSVLSQGAAWERHLTFVHFYPWLLFLPGA